MAPRIDWKCGFEIEMLAPVGMSRRDLADALAANAGGHVERLFYPQSELSLVPGQPVFENLILGFTARDADGSEIAKCVDDLTLQADLDMSAASREGWYRILSDDIRLLRLVMAQCDPDAPRREVLRPVARLFGTEPVHEDEDITRLADAMGASVAIAATLPGERERPCELITPPIETEHAERLNALIRTARSLGFTVPKEAAVHIHFDAELLRQTRVFARLVEVLSRHGGGLKALVGANPACRRAGPLPQALVELTSTHRFQNLAWPEACVELEPLQLSKYCDFNLLNVISDIPGKATFEARIFPGSMDVNQILHQAVLFEAILTWCVETPSLIKLPQAFEDFLGRLPMADDTARFWRSPC